MVNKMANIEEMAKRIECIYDEETNMIRIEKMIDGNKEWFDIWDCRNFDKMDSDTGQYEMTHIPSCQDVEELSDYIDVNSSSEEILALCDKLFTMPHRKKIYHEPVKLVLDYYDQNLSYILDELKSIKKMDGDKKKVKVEFDDVGNSIICVERYDLEPFDELYNRVEVSDEVVDFQKQEYYKLIDERVSIIRKLMVVLDELDNLQNQQDVNDAEIESHPCYVSFERYFS